MPKPYFRPQAPQQKRLRINHYIRSPQLSVIDQDGNQLGTLDLKKALELAQEQDLDLVEVGPYATPPVAKIMDYGKYIYQKEKKEREAKKPKSQETKTVKLGLRTGTHDLEIRAGQIDKFLEKGYRVKIELRLRGREKSMGNLAKEKLKLVQKTLTHPFVVDEDVKFSPQGLHTLIRPDTKQKHATTQTENQQIST